jgi:hypothetical protein
VEDYTVEIQDLPTDFGTVVLRKVTDPPGGVNFDFLEDLGLPDFSLDDGASLTIPYVPAGSYTITETLPIGWELTGVDCETDDPNDTTSWGGTTLTIDLDVGETITCTFNNAALGSITLRKETYPPLDISFDFLADFGIGLPDLELDGNGSLTIPYVPAGTYSVTEAGDVPFDLDLIDVECEDPDGGSSVDLDSRTAIIDLDPGENITCTFFNGRQHTLTVEVVGGGAVVRSQAEGWSGWVISEPEGISCGADCIENYVEDTEVTLTAHPGVKTYFVGWSGDCEGTERTDQVIMDTDRHCIATFGYPVGGAVVPLDRLGLAVPWMGLAALAGLAALGMVMVRKRRSA